MGRFVMIYLAAGWIMFWSSPYSLALAAHLMEIFAR